MSLELGIMYSCNPITWQRQEGQEFQVLFGYAVSLESAYLKSQILQVVSIYALSVLPTKL